MEICKEIDYSTIKETYNELLDIFSANGIIERHELSLKTRINYDLSIDGDDWNDYVERITKKFNFNFHNFNPYIFFHSEGEISLLIWVHLIPLFSVLYKMVR